MIYGNRLSSLLITNSYEDDITNFIYLNYQINDSYILRVSYDIKGDSDREFINEIGGTKQLMQNLYNVINVIE